MVGVPTPADYRRKTKQIGWMASLAEWAAAWVTRWRPRLIGRERAEWAAAWVIRWRTRLIGRERAEWAAAWVTRWRPRLIGREQAEWVAALVIRWRRAHDSGRSCCSDLC